MVYAVVILLGVVVGLLAKGRFSNLINTRFNKPGIILTAFLLYAALMTAGSRLKLSAVLMIAIEAAVFFLLLAGFWFNRKYVGVWFIAAGYFLNNLVIMLNGGKMPISIDVVRKAGLSDTIQGEHIKHAIVNIDESTRLPFLADIIHPPFFLGYGMQVVSIGDLVIAAGLFFIVVQMMTGKQTETKNGK